MAMENLQGFQGLKAMDVSIGGELRLFAAKQSWLLW